MLFKWFWIHVFLNKNLTKFVLGPHILRMVRLQKGKLNETKVSRVMCLSVPLCLFVPLLLVPRDEPYYWYSSTADYYSAACFAATCTICFAIYDDGKLNQQQQESSGRGRTTTEIGYETRSIMFTEALLAVHHWLICSMYLFFYPDTVYSCMPRV